MAIKIIKPIKHIRQKNETKQDAVGLLSFVSEIAKGADTSGNIRIHANNLTDKDQFIDNPQGIINQMIAVQDQLGVEDDNRGKRIYPLTYKFNKEEYDITVEKAEDMTKKLLDKHPTFQGIAAISENTTDITVSVVFNNYSNDYMRMTKSFKPYHMSNFYNQKHRR